MLIPVSNCFDFLEIREYALIIPYKNSQVIYVKLMSIISEILFLLIFENHDSGFLLLHPAPIWFPVGLRRPPVAGPSSAWRVRGMR